MRSSSGGDGAVRMPAQRLRDQVRDGLFEFGAGVLDQRGLGGGAEPAGQLAGHRQRHGAQGGQPAQDLAQRLGGLRVVDAFGAAMLQPALRQRHAGVNALGAAALERQFGVDLRPAVALFADQGLRVELDVVEEHFREVRVAGQVFDGPDGYAGQGQVDDHLGQALVPVGRRARGAHQRDHVVRAMRIGGPDLAAVEQPAAVARLGAGADAGQVGARVRFAHADAEKSLGAADARQVEAALLLGAVFQDQRRALAVGDPVRRDRRACAQQFFRQHEAREMPARGAAVFARQRHAQPAALGQGAAEAGVEAHPGTRPLVGGPAGHGAGQEFADVGAQRLVFGGDGGQFKGIDHVSVRLLGCGGLSPLGVRPV